MKRFALCAALSCLTSFAHAQPKVGDRFGDWVFQCMAFAEGRTACALTYSIVSKVDNRRIAQLSLGRNEERKSIVLTAFLPLGIYLPAGASATPDQGTPLQLTIETCLPAQGCIALAALGGDFLKALQAAKQLSISFVAADGQKPVVLEVPLAGLGEGLKAARLE
jgi:invasion protein IalB